MPLRDYGCIILSCPQRLAQRTSTRANASCGLAILAVGVHPVPYRTRKLSPHALMVLQGQPCGRVGRRHPTSRIGSFFCLSARFGALSCWYRSIVGIRPTCSSTSSEKRRASPSWGSPPSFASTVGRDLSPTRRLCARLYAQMVSAASLPEVRAQPLLAPEGLLEPMTAPTTSPQANRPWMDSPALFWTSSEPLTTRPPMVVA